MRSKIISEVSRVTKAKRWPRRLISARLRANSASNSLTRSCAQVAAAIVRPSSVDAAIGMLTVSSLPSGWRSVNCRVVSASLKMPATCSLPPCANGDATTSCVAPLALALTTRVAVESRAAIALATVSLPRSIARPPLRWAMCLRKTLSVFIADEMV